MNSLCCRHLTRMLLTLSAVSIVVACSGPLQPGPSSTDGTISPYIAKWYDNHTAAISLTYDSGWPASEEDKLVQEYILAQHSHLDYEIVTDTYRTYTVLSNYLMQVLLPQGFGVFGHGDMHINHDTLSYKDAYASFKRCYKTLQSYGIQPVAYAYPRWTWL